MRYLVGHSYIRWPLQALKRSLLDVLLLDVADGVVDVELRIPEELRVDVRARVGLELVVGVLLREQLGPRDEQRGLARELLVDLDAWLRKKEL